MKTKLFLCSLLLAFANLMDAQKTIKLWEGNPPVSNGITEPENINKDYWITNVSVPELTIYLPPNATNTGKAVVICPGGGYAGLASMHEGTMFAQWLNEQGIAAFVLKYRMPNKHKNVPLEDAWQAIRHVREHASEYQIQVNKIGIAGFSAGGHLASTASTHFAPSGTSTRPDFSILFYPVITMDITTHGGSRMNLLGDNPSLSDLYLFSNEKQVNNTTPPAILLLSDDDKVVLPENSTHYYNALKANDIKATMYIFSEGGHGWGLRKDFKFHTEMTTLLASWLKNI
ncbi:MAG: alpha/beta hydrolase [Massilibacteroides sp.]|nr:alpha/beta hydrolase [Massilibacteroides sp.]MDD3062525.1 alpha/beta hydrolase [Massilibacteroides sp.]MDD4115530.1 alpha/beta hydrolase [Massilibacteroides sp.]MDD4660329.1 alpha/beta hydrolase [Massilibacteroides sp.]